jgi:hypothetical protein
MEQKNLTVQQPTQVAIPFSEIERMAVAFAKSGLFGIKTAEQGVALMLIAQAEGMHPAIAARDFHIVDGKPTLKADAMLARFQAAGGKVVWNAYTDVAVSGTFSHPSGGSATVEWTIAQAESVGLTRKSVWRQYPRAMLRARVISEGIRTVYPGVSVGVYTPEEIEGMDAKPATKEVEAVQVHEPKLTPPPAPKTSGKISAEFLPNFDRKEAFKLLAGSSWHKPDLATYSEKAFGKKASKDLSDEELKLFVKVVQTSSFETAILEVAPDYEVDLP